MNKSKKNKKGRTKLSKHGNRKQQTENPNLSEMSRKEMRKLMRTEKKAKKHAYFSRKGKMISDDTPSTDEPLKLHSKQTTVIKSMSQTQKAPKKKADQTKFEKAKEANRKRLLLQENKLEEKRIRALEKKLKIHKRKSKTFPKLFVNDGLDYLLEVCDSQRIADLHEPADFDNADADIEDDVAIATGHHPNEGAFDSVAADASSESDSSSADNRESGSEEDGEDVDDDDHQEQGRVMDTCDVDSDEDDKNGKRKKVHRKSEKPEKRVRFRESQSDVESTSEDDDDEQLRTVAEALRRKRRGGGQWEDVYGRLRDESGNVITEERTSGRYVPPALRPNLGSDKAKSESLKQLTRQLKGLLNRLSESNVHSIAAEIEGLYMRHSHNDMCETLSQLIMDVIVQTSQTPERLVQETCLLIAVLHANIGVEIGAHFLEVTVDKLDELMKQDGGYGDGKQCDNLILLLLHLYTFQIVNCVLIYDVLDLLAESFQEKDIKLILLIFRCAGFALRKDDPARLKSSILNIQKKAISSSSTDRMEVRFMLDTLMAIRNNNMQKIPNYDPSYTEHLRKLLRGLIRKGNAVTELNISLSDVRSAKSKGRWWVVGSAWSGQDTQNKPFPETATNDSLAVDNFGSEIHELARKQRINTDIRKNIFCIVMTAEDYLDAMEKLLRLGLKNQQEREIVNVVIDCCLQEKRFNLYYAYILERFCSQDRKFQIMIQCFVWDKLKENIPADSIQSSNLAHLLAHMLLKGALAISILKVIQFADMNTNLVRFLRQLLLGVLLHDSENEVQSVFGRIAGSSKLKTLREGLRLFMRHFLLKNKGKLAPELREKLESRIRLAEGTLTSREVTTKL